MRKSLQQISEKFPAFLLLLPAFYYLNVAVNVYSPGMRNLLFSQFAIHFSAGLLVSAVFFIFWKDYRKAVMFSFILLCFYFFFSPLVDLMKQVFGKNSFVTKYTILLPFFALLLTYLGYRIYKTGKQFKRLFFFFNLLFLVLCVFEIVRLSSTKYGSYSEDKVVSQFKDYNKKDLPDVYLIIADEYAGQMQLVDKFGYDNSNFFDSLRKRGFYVSANSTSNYNHTVYSMASLFSMDYLSLKNNNRMEMSDNMLAEDIINKNSVISFFEKNNYRFRNISFFEFTNQKKVANHFQIHQGKSVVNYNTLFNKFLREVGYHFATLLKSKNGESEYDLNSKVDSILNIRINESDAIPDFFYVHYLLPHPPYHFDSTGNANTNAWIEDMPDDLNRNYYLSYLKFSNKKLLKTIDKILKESRRPPVIILASDHGYRQGKEKTDKKYYFSNLISVYLPDRDYSQFYDGISSVNIFRAVLNSQFEQKLVFLKDSCIYMP